MHRSLILIAVFLNSTLLLPLIALAQPALSGAQTRLQKREPVAAKLAQLPTASLPPRSATPNKSQTASVLPSPGGESSDEAALKLFQPVSQLASDWLKRPELTHSVVGLEIMDVPSGRVLFSSNGGKRMVTASIAKVLTTACAFETFGPDYRYRTSIMGYGDIKNARLSGNLMLVPSQDPSFERKDLQELVHAVKNHGIQYVTGRLGLQSVSGGGDHFSTEWLIQDWGQDWMPVSADLVMDRNILAGDPGGGYPLNFGSSATETSALTLSLLRAPWGSAWAVFNKGTVTFYRPDIPVNGGIVVGNPNEYNLAMLRMSLHNAGVKVDGHDIQTGEPSTLADHTSQPLSEILRFCLKRSDNLYAQQLLRTLGTYQQPLSRNLEHASLEDRGLARLHSWLSSIGVPAGEVIIWDGCGLSRKNAITPHAMNLVLRHMSGASGNGAYLDLMLHGSEGVASWRYKTGAMDSVRSISGIVKTSTGQPLAVTAIVNDHLPAVGELRMSLASLISRLQSLGSLKLTPVKQTGAKRSVGQGQRSAAGGSAIARRRRAHR